MNFYKPKYFELYELVSKDIYTSYASNLNLLWYIFNPEALYTLDRLRIKYGKITINDWKWNLNNPSNYRGWRDLGCKIGSILSQHKFGNAFDCIPNNITAEEIRQDILKDPFNEDFKYITCIEDKVNWLHFDCRNWDKDQFGIKIVLP